MPKILSATILDECKLLSHLFKQCAMFENGQKNPTLVITGN